MIVAIVALGLTACPSAPEPAPVTTPPPIGDPRPSGPATTPAPTPALTIGGAASRPTFEHVRLDNGVEVWVFPDAGAPLAIVEVWVAVGSADERETRPGDDHGITGLSHFFEHLMFRGTTRFPRYDDVLNPLGARNNAFTYHDATAYWVFTPREHVRFVLDLEADRFEHMQLDFVSLEPEREVVKGERRQGVDSDPGQLADERATRNAFDKAPYRWGPIGWLSDLDAITLEEAQAYHTEHYRPDRTSLLIVGDVDPAQTIVWVKELWGKLPARAGAGTAERPAPEPELWVGPRTDHLVEESPVTKVVWAYRTPSPRDARAYAALEVLDTILASGKAGRLQERLVFGAEPQLSTLSASLFPLRDPFLYTWSADLLDAASVGSVEATMDEAFRSIVTDGVSADELARAVATLRTEVVRQSLGLSDRADAMGFSLRATGSPLAHLDRLALYPTITDAEIRQAARTWLVPERRSRVVVVRPARLLELVAAWEQATPGAPWDGVMVAAAEQFIAAERQRRAVAEADREERAIAMLAQRGDVAKAKAEDPAARRAIDKYLSDSTSGTVKRRAALAATRRELAKEGARVTKAGDALRATIEKRAKVDAARLQGPALTAVRLLLADPRTLAIPVPSSNLTIDHAGAQALALQVVSAWVLEAHGLAQSAEEARQVVLRVAPRFGSAAGPLVKLAYGLAHDTSVQGLLRVDRPLGAVRPTNERAR